MTDTQIRFLKKLQKQMRYEERHDNDGQAGPRFWVIMDYRTVPAHEEYNAEFKLRIHNDGDCTEFSTAEDLRDFLLEYAETKKLSSKDLAKFNGLINSTDTTFDKLWKFAKKKCNPNGYFRSVASRSEGFIVPDTMFLTKQDANDHLGNNKGHYTSKAHTYAMTAWRSPSVERLIQLLLDTDFDSEIEPSVDSIVPEQAKFRGFCIETNSWHYGHGWLNCNYTDKYKSEAGVNDRAMLYTNGSPVECELSSMGRFFKAVGYQDARVDLYEGDIVANVTDVELQEKYEVFWNGDEGMFLFIPLFKRDVEPLTYVELEELHGDNIYPVSTIYKINNQ